MRRSWTLGLAEVVAVIQRENLGEPHAVLAGGERYVSPRFDGQPHAPRDAELVDALTLVQRATEEHYAWISAHTGQPDQAALVAAVGRTGVLLTTAGDTVTLAEVDGERLLDVLVRQLPDVPAGSGESISIRAADYAPPGAPSDHDVPGFLKAAPAARPQTARRLDQLLAAQRRGGAQLYTARRDRAGTHRRAADWITVLDLTHYGRWLIYARTGRGERAINALPGTPDLLATKLRELHATLTA